MELVRGLRILDPSMQHKLAALAVSALVVLSSTSTALADVQITIQQGRVTVVAKDATVRQILAEWARVGQANIVNVDRIPGGPLTLELTDVPEQQALDILLRAVSGYVAAPRAVPVANASVFDRIVVMPTTAAPAAAPSPQAAPSAQSGTQPPRPLFDEDPDDDRAFPPAPGQGRPPIFSVPPPIVNGPGGRLATPAMVGPSGQQFPPLVIGPNGQQFPPPLPPVPGGPPPAATYPGAATTPTPVGAAAPGMIVPAPAPQQQPVPVFPGQQPQ